MDQNMSEERPTINIDSNEEFMQILGQIENQQTFTFHHDVVSKTSKMIIIGCDGIEYHIHLELDPSLFDLKRKADEENEIVANKICKLSHDE